MSILSMKSEWCPTRLKYLWNFIVEKETDVEDLPHCHEGSTATVQETGNAYVINSAGTWSVGERDDSVVSPANKVYVTDSSGVPGWVERTHYDAKEYSFPANTSCLSPKITTEVITVQGGSSVSSYKYLGRMSLVTPTREEIMLNGILGGRTSKAALAEEQIVQGAGDGYVIFDADLSQVQVAVAFSATTLRIPRSLGGEYVLEITAPGLYLYGGSRSQVSLSWGGVRPLDEKYIPSTIARKTDLEGLGGAVKSVNGVEPDENGAVEFDKAFPVLITHMIFPAFSDIQCNKTCEEIYSGILTQEINAASIALLRYFSTSEEEYRYCANVVLEKVDRNFTKRFFFYFGDDIAPFIVDVNTNTITLDPDWVAPDASDILTDSSGKKWKLIVGTDGTLSTEAVIT